MGKAIGIDFGTTTTEVSYIDEDGFSRSLKLEKGKEVIPTVLYFLSEDKWIIGDKAKTSSRSNPSACVKNFKLFFTDPLKKYNVIAENKDEFIIKPIQAAQYYLNSLIEIVQPKLMNRFGVDGMIDKAIITAPAMFDEFKRSEIKEAMQKAGSKAGFSDVIMATEPTAAAVAYQDENCEDGDTILVYDFGGGTFDVSIIKKNGEVYTEIETGGDPCLGGNLLTEKIAEVLWDKCIEKVDRDYPFDEDEADNYSEDDYELARERFYLNRNAVFNEAEALKIEFSDDDIDEDRIIPFYSDNDNDSELISITISIEEFNEIIKPVVEKTIEITKNVVNRVMTDGRVDRIDQVVLAGGSSQLNLVSELLQQESELRDLNLEQGETSTLISRGAALLANKELEVEEKTRVEIGTRVVEGVSFGKFTPIIGVGEKLPCKAEHPFYLSRVGQEEVDIEYYEKDINNYPDADSIDDEGINLIGVLKITGIPKQKGLRLNVEFTIEKDGTPKIEAEILDDSGKIVKADQLSIDKRGNLY